MARMDTAESPNLPEQLHQRPGTDVARRYGGTDEPGLDAGDILIPRMKIGQKTSRDVLEYGAIYVLASRDDMEPQLMAASPKVGELGSAVRFYVHGDPRKGWSWKPRVEGGEWRGKDYPSLSDVENNEPRNVRRTYDYLLTLPDYPLLPVMFIMHGQWGGQAAKQINTSLLLNRQRGIESHTVAFKLQAKRTSSPSDGQERPFMQAIVGLDKVSVKDKKADLELVQSHIDLVGTRNTTELDDSDTGSSPVATDAPSLD